MANISSIKAASLSMCFSVGAVLFSSHAGGGFATGNQENVYFVSSWLASNWITPSSPQRRSR